MKKIILVILIGILTVNCSSDESQDNSESSSKSSLSFTLDNKTEYSSIHDEKINNYDIFPTTWEKKQVTNTSESTYTISSSVSIKGEVDEYYHYVDFNIITSDNNLQVNKTYDIDIDVALVLDLPLAKDPAVCYTSATLFNHDKTIGKVKITSFDGETLRGEFTISNLSNSNGYSNIGFCNGVQIKERFFNITKGIFYSIPKGRS